MKTLLLVMLIVGIPVGFLVPLAMGMIQQTYDRRRVRVAKPVR